MVLAPNALAFGTSYATPTAGLSCRSLTYLVYAACQVGEMALWAWAARLRVSDVWLSSTSCLLVMVFFLLPRQPLPSPLHLWAS
ncbi:hypothetical protein GGR56DRAFT_619750 [Xylariaceae sp. FL0804]|nr:hypothetical protein GGR56DRAFT_619750 [Xylariaceae sp. FL0804]